MGKGGATALAEELKDNNTLEELNIRSILLLLLLLSFSLSVTATVSLNDWNLGTGEVA